VRRVLGVAFGLGLGLGLAYVASRMLHKAKTELPGAIAAEAKEAASSVGERLRSALDEGVRAMKETEAELRGKVLGSSN